MVATSEGVSKLIQRVAAYLPESAAGIVGEAYDFAERCHDGQRRKSGEPYIAHPLETALYLADLNLDDQTIIAALLHDVVEDCGVSLDEINRRFGPEVTKLVDGVTKLTRMDIRLHEPADGIPDITDDPDNLYAENLRKMLVSMAEDIRVVLIKLADRLHNMRTLDALPVEKRRRIAQETLDIYSPLAHRLGIWEIKWRLDDLAFRHLDEAKYREISKILAAKRQEREDYVEKVAAVLRADLELAGINGEVVGRPKSIYSTYRKMKKYETQGKELREIYDLFALRVLVANNADCYRTLGAVHQLWHPIPGQFDDYIANPKENMYQALHTTVMCEGGTASRGPDQDLRVAPSRRIRGGRSLALQGRKDVGPAVRRKDDLVATALGMATGGNRHHRVHRLGQAGHLQRPSLRLHAKGTHRRIDRRVHSGGLRLQDSH